MRTPARFDESSLKPEEAAFLARARAKFRANMDWFAFEEFAFGMRSPLFSRTRTHKDVRENPLYLALRDMWLELGVRQGHIAASRGTEEGHAARRKASRRR